MTLHGLPDVDDVRLDAQDLERDIALIGAEETLFDLVDVGGNMQEHREERFVQTFEKRRDELRDPAAETAFPFVTVALVFVEDLLDDGKGPVVHGDDSLRFDEAIQLDGRNDARLPVEHGEQEDQENVPFPDHELVPLERRKRFAEIDRMVFETVPQIFDVLRKVA